MWSPSQEREPLTQRNVAWILNILGAKETTTFSNGKVGAVYAGQEIRIWPDGRVTDPRRKTLFVVEKTSDIWRKLAFDEGHLSK